MARELVFLHGFTHTGASWDPVRAALGERYRAVAPDIRGHGTASEVEPVAAVAPDIRGHGTASEVEPVALEAVIVDVAAAARSDAFTLVGYSMGGRIAIHLALTLPARVQRLVLIGASPGLADPDERAARRAADDVLADEIEGMGIDAFVARWGQTPVLAGQPPQVRALVDADRLRNTPAGLARALRGLGTGALHSVWDRLGELSMPVTLVVGERDAKFRAIAADMARRIPNAEIVTVPGAGHAVHLEAPDAVAALLGVPVE